LPSASNIRWLGRLSDDELAGLLRQSLCLAFPSFTEGFGLPALEAMTIGCPVVVADRTSLPEICGDAALYAAPDDPQGWLSAFARLQQYPWLHQQLVARGRDRARQFSWLRSAELYLELMALIDGIALKPSALADGLGNVEERRLTPEVFAVSLKD
jgi:glycosyltransferase involved in cell wall biosynthesis